MTAVSVVRCPLSVVRSPLTVDAVSGRRSRVSAQAHRLPVVESRFCPQVVVATKRLTGAEGACCICGNRAERHPLPTGEGRRGAPAAETESSPSTQRSGGVRGQGFLVNVCRRVPERTPFRTGELRGMDSLKALTPHPGSSALTALEPTQRCAGIARYGADPLPVGEGSPTGSAVVVSTFLPSFRRPRAMSGYPIPDTRHPVPHLQRTTDNGQRATDNDQRTTSNGQRTTTNDQRTTDNEVSK